MRRPGAKPGKTAAARPAGRVLESKLSAALAAAPTLITRQDRSLRYIWACSPAPGFDPLAIVGRIDSELFPAGVLGRLKRLKHRVLRTGSPACEEIGLVVDGVPRSFELLVQPILRENHPIGVATAMTDVGPRLEAQRSLLASERFLRATLDSLAWHIAIVDSSQRVVEANSSWEVFTRRCRRLLPSNAPACEFFGACQLAQSLAASGPCLIQQGLVDVLQGRRPQFHLEYPLWERWYSVAIRPFACNGDLYAVVVHEDITARKQSELAASRSHERLKAVMDSAVDAIITIDGRGRVESVNPATSVIFGYEPVELIGKDIGVLMPSPHRENHRGHLQRYLRTGERRVVGTQRELTARKKDGTLFPVSIAVSEVEPGRLFTGVVRDLSAWKLAEARARAADRMASLGTLAAGLGHDMNNMLLPMRANLGAATARSVPPAVRDRLSDISKSVDYLQQLADGLHYLTMNPESREGERTRLAEWWSQTGALLSRALPRHAQLKASIPPGLPEVLIAPHRLTQAVFNLVVNAGQAIPRKSRGLVEISAGVCSDDPDKPAVRLSVRDNGEGMPEAVRRRAFDLFFTTKTRALGTGLGLPLVQQLVSSAGGGGGSVHIESAPGHGTTVTLHLPAAESAVPQPRASASRRRAVITLGNQRAAAVIRQMLAPCGVRMLAHAGVSRADLWVTDPGMTTLRTADAWLRRAKGRSRLVVVPAEPWANDAAQRWLAIGARVVEDPSDLSQLRTAVLGADNPYPTPEPVHDHPSLGGTPDPRRSDRRTRPPLVKVRDPASGASAR